MKIRSILSAISLALLLLILEDGGATFHQPHFFTRRVENNTS